MNDKKDIIELSNIEMHEHCLLNIATGNRQFNRGKKQIPQFTGLYFKDQKTFFALYPTEKGPMMYYKEKEYKLSKDLHIELRKTGKEREFIIDEYDIRILYTESPYIGIDVWSDEENVDLFYQIVQFYQKDEYYKKFTK